MSFSILIVQQLSETVIVSGKRGKCAMAVEAFDAVIRTHIKSYIPVLSRKTGYILDYFFSAQYTFRRCIKTTY